MRVGYIDGLSGASGDMLLGALLDAGWPEAELRQTLGQLPVTGWHLAVSRPIVHGVAATQISFDLPGNQPLRHLPDLLALLAAGRFPEPIPPRAEIVFRALGEAEAAVHGLPVEEVHFHEIGALDTLFDVVGVVAGLHALGVERLYVGPLNVGGGSVRIAHGLVPVPPPAVARLATKLITYGAPDVGELLTPTGAALLATLGTPVSAQPRMRPNATGYGAGQKALPHANVVRLTIGETTNDSPARETLTLLSCNVDDMNPEIYPYLSEQLFTAGALDVWLTPVIMKKGRPAVVINVLSQAATASTIRALLFRETTTLGVRSSEVQRDRLERRWERVETAYGPIRVKVGLLDGEVLNRAPEYEECATAARQHGVSLKAVYAASLAGVLRPSASEGSPS